MAKNRNITLRISAENDNWLRIYSAVNHSGLSEVLNQILKEYAANNPVNIEGLTNEV
jgi:hypothetical protein